MSPTYDAVYDEYTVAVEGYNDRFYVEEVIYCASGDSDNDKVILMSASEHSDPYWIMVRVRQLV